MFVSHALLSRNLVWRVISSWLTMTVLSGTVSSVNNIFMFMLPGRSMTFSLQTNNNGAEIHNTDAFCLCCGLNVQKVPQTFTLEMLWDWFLFLSRLDFTQKNNYLKCKRDDDKEDTRKLECWVDLLSIHNWIFSCIALNLSACLWVFGVVYQIGCEWLLSWSYTNRA